LYQELWNDIKSKILAMCQEVYSTGRTCRKQLNAECISIPDLLSILNTLRKKEPLVSQIDELDVSFGRSLTDDKWITIMVRKVAVPFPKTTKHRTKRVASR
jgi:hypothetical protein